MKTARQLGLTLTAVLLSGLVAVSLSAQDHDPNQNANPANDPPARVARIQYISGEVSMQPGGVNDWVAASLNRPLTTSDRVWADKNSRAELNVGDGFIRLNSETSVTLTNVSNNAVQLQLDQGTIELTVQHLEPGEIFEVDAPNLAFTVMKSGVYRIDVPPNENQTWVTVRKGQGEATGQGPAVKVSSGSQVRFSGQGSLQNVAYAAPAPDGFDGWAQVRDKRLEGTLSAQYVAPGVIGYQDLDYYGTWQVVPTYGAIWVPTAVPGGWAPYRYGHWVWVAPWGWTWVDNAPWGFAPFHYGRWVYYGGAWGWAPGPVYVGWRPYYAPALVAWVGGSGWGVGVSFGFGWGSGCGWFPLGWGEPYYPTYRGYHGAYVSQTYVRNVNVTNTRITNINVLTNNYYNNAHNQIRYANRTVAGAVTAAPRSALVNGQNIARVGVAVPRADLGKGEVLRNADVNPTLASRFGGRAPLTTAVPPRSAISRPVITRNEAPARMASSPTEAHNIPPAPALSGAHNSNTENATPANSVARPPERTSGASSAATVNSPAQAAPQHVVPKPPYAGSRAPSAPESTARNSGESASGRSSPPRQESTSGAQAAPPANHNQHPSQAPRETKPKDPPKSTAELVSPNVPRPPANYTYHPAPVYNASPYAGGGSSYQSARNYGGSAQYSRGSYVTPSATYRDGYNSPAASAVHTIAPPRERAYSGGSHSSGPGSSGGRANYSGGHKSNSR